MGAGEFCAGFVAHEAAVGDGADFVDQEVCLGFLLTEFAQRDAKRVLLCGFGVRNQLPGVGRALVSRPFFKVHRFVLLQTRGRELFAQENHSLF